MHFARHFQNAFVTRDIAKSAALFEQLYGMELPWREVEAQVLTPTGPDRVECKVALGWHGTLQFELIEPLGGAVDFYREVLGPDDHPYFHHLGHRVVDWAAAMAWAADAGFPVVVEGEAGPIRFAYLDTRAALGHYSEFILKPETMWPERFSATLSSSL